MVQEAVHEEIKWLEERLEAKKQELASGGVEKPEKEMVREVIEDVSLEKTPPQVGGGAPTSDGAAQKAAFALKEKEHAHIIEELVALALAKGLTSTLKIANLLKNPHILDELHDTLADKYYEKLLAARKLKA